MAALAAATACGLPTEVPQVDQRWIVPPRTTTIGVANLLPATVRVLPDSSAFALDVSAASVTRALSADCAPCVATNGTRVPKPTFVVNTAVSTPLPSGVVSASLASGSLQLSLANGYNFDPLRPSATARGFAVITVANGTTMLGRDSVDGNVVALPAGGALQRTIALTPAQLSGDAPVTVTVWLDSPAGDSVQMDASRAITATVAPVNLRIPTVQSDVIAHPVSATTSLDLQDADATIASHITGGSLLFDIDNPFAVGGTFGVQFSGTGFATIARSITIAPGHGTQSVALSQDELRSLVGHLVVIRVAGPVTETSGPVTLSPRQVVLITSRLDFTLHTGG